MESNSGSYHQFRGHQLSDSLGGKLLKDPFFQGSFTCLCCIIFVSFWSNGCSEALCYITAHTHPVCIGRISPSAGSFGWKRLAPRDSPCLGCEPPWDHSALHLTMGPALALSPLVKDWFLDGSTTHLAVVNQQKESAALRMRFPLGPHVRNRGLDGSPMSWGFSSYFPRWPLLRLSTILDSSSLSNQL